MRRHNGPSDHDLLVEIRAKIMDDGGLIDRFSKIESALLGTMNGKLGLIPQFDRHLEDHDQQWNRMFAVLAAAATGIGALVSWVLDFLFHR